MCVTVVARVVTVDAERGTAIVESDGRRSEVSLAPVVLDGGRVDAGDWVLVHTGLALAVISDREAREHTEAIAALTSRGGLEP